jgi:hypothetical protein
MITKQFFNKGSGGLWRLTAPKDMAEELEVQIKETLDSIDRWSSPTIDSRRQVNDKIIVDIKFYGLD